MNKMNKNKVKQEKKLKIKENKKIKKLITNGNEVKNKRIKNKKKYMNI